MVALANEAGTVVENGRFAYDPWGKRRNPSNWAQDDTRTNWIVSRGYTMHEHLDMFSIINMNGRVYDPLTAMFFSPDPFVQAPDNWLNYNRYAYGFGNPLIYIDPSGEFILKYLIVTIGKIVWNTVVVVIGTTIMIGGAIGGVYVGVLTGSPVVLAGGLLLGTYIGVKAGVWVIESLWWK